MAGDIGRGYWLGGYWLGGYWPNTPHYISYIDIATMRCLVVSVTLSLVVLSIIALWLKY